MLILNKWVNLKENSMLKRDTRSSFAIHLHRNWTGVRWLLFKHQFSSMVCVQTGHPHATSHFHIQRTDVRISLIIPLIWTVSLCVKQFVTSNSQKMTPKPQKIMFISATEDWEYLNPVNINLFEQSSMMRKSNVQIIGLKQIKQGISAGSVYSWETV